MKYASLIVCVAGSMMVNAVPATSQATELTLRPQFETSRQAANVQRRWLAQFGTDVRVEPLCNISPKASVQVLSQSSCEALSNFQSAPARATVRSVRVSHIKRNRALWNTIPRREQRILETYEVIVVGQARAVENQIGLPR